MLASVVFKMSSSEFTAQPDGTFRADESSSAAGGGDPGADVTENEQAEGLGTGGGAAEGLGTGGGAAGGGTLEQHVAEATERARRGKVGTGQAAEGWNIWDIKEHFSSADAAGIKRDLPQLDAQWVPVRVICRPYEGEDMGCDEDVRGFLGRMEDEGKLIVHSKMAIRKGDGAGTRGAFARVSNESFGSKSAWVVRNLLMRASQDMEVYDGEEFLWEGMRAAHELGTEGNEEGWCTLSTATGKQFRYIVQGENDCSQHLLWAPQKLGVFRQRLAGYFPELDAVEEGCFSHSTKTDATGCWFHPWSGEWLKKVTMAFGMNYFKVLQDKDKHSNGLKCRPGTTRGLVQGQQRETALCSVAMLEARRVAMGRAVRPRRGRAGCRTISSLSYQGSMLVR